ncbi:hypothetical protein [Cerasicoccus frondis]|uniref:hypothetical protein n=1 Tax=Cerasicoccus frondis TaxID=490090 RepID=UPI002852CBF6|nr:hypothetical protein [Cerasicoccus frondis]
MLIRHCLSQSLLLFASVLAVIADTPETSPAKQEVIILEETPPAEDASEEEKASYWERVRTQYEDAKEATGDYYDKAKNKTGAYYDKAKGATSDAYDKAKETTSGWYEDARDWTQEDIKKAGSWHYRVVVVEQADIRENPAAIETMLNDLGQERFECFWVEPLDAGNSRIAFFFKKSGFSYLKSIPAKEFWRFMPKGSDGSETSEP